MNELTSEKRSRVYAIRVFIASIFSSTICAVSWGVIAYFAEHIMANTGCSLTQYGFLFSLMNAGMLCANFFSGKVITMNPKLWGCIGACGGLSFFLAVSFSNSYVVVLLTALLFGIGMNLCQTTWNMVMLMNWVNKGRSSFIGINNVCQNASYLVILPIYAAIFGKVGASSTAMIVGLITFAVTVASIGLLAAGTPEKYNLQPADFAFKTRKKEKVQTDIDDFESSFKAPRLVATPVFILTFLVLFLLMFANNVYNANSVGIMTGSMGLSMEQATILISMGGLIGMAWSFITGVIGDIIGITKALIIGAAALAVVCLCFGLFSGFGGALVFVLAVPFCATSTMLPAASFPRVFGRLKSGALMSWAAIGGAFMGIIAAPFGNAIYTKTGSYTPVFMLAGICAIVAILFLVYLGTNKAKDSVRVLEAKN